MSQSTSNQYVTLNEGPEKEKKHNSNKTKVVVAHIT